MVTEDGAPWPFEDGQFDVVILAFVLHHVPLSGRELLLAESVRVGREVLVLEDFLEGSPSCLSNLLKAASRHSHDDDSF